MNQDEAELVPTIEAMLVHESKRLAILPKYVGARGMMLFEEYVYGYAGKFAKSYNGGFWNMWELSNGGFYMSPEEDCHWHIEVLSNGFVSSLSSQGLGIVACLFALSHMGNLNGEEHYFKRFHQLRDFACEHKDRAQILGAID
jgi:hypothetical protein